MHAASRKFYKQEVFRSDKQGEHIPSEVAGKCLVMFIKDYVRGRPASFKGKEADVFVCESRYIENAKRIEKIKNWKVGLPGALKDVEPELTMLSEPIVLEKVPSPFAHDMDDEDEELDVEEDDASEYSDEGSKKRGRVSTVPIPKIDPLGSLQEVLKARIRKRALRFAFLRRLLEGYHMEIWVATRWQLVARRVIP